MTSLQKKTKGFTLVELLVVIVIIAILATLVIVVVAGATKRARDNQRQTDVAAIESVLQAYYADNGNYPTLANLQDPTWVKTNLKGLDPDSLVDPKTPAADVTSSATGILGTANATHYGYAVTPSGCDNSTTPCDNFTLTANLENSSDPFVKESHN